MHPDTALARGDIYWVDWNPSRGSEQSGRGPALVVQRDAGNRSPTYRNTIVVAISTRGRDQFSHVVIEPDDGNGLTERSFVKCEQILTVSKDRLSSRIGSVDAETMARVDVAIKNVLSLT